MILSAPSQSRKQLLAGLLVGVYAAAIALAPSLEAKALLCAPLIAIPIFWRLLSTPTAWLALFLGCALLTPPIPIPLGDSGPHIAIAIAGLGLFIGLLRLGEWRFQPATKNGIPISVPCSVELIWGRKELTSPLEGQLHDVLATR